MLMASYKQKHKMCEIQVAKRVSSSELHASKQLNPTHFWNFLKTEFRVHARLDVFQ